MLPQIRVASPCTADWERMTGDNRVRHCAECDLNVYNFAEMTSSEIEQLIAASKGQRLCGRLYRRADGTMITSDCPVGFRAVVRRVSRYACAALSAALSIAPVAAQTPQAGSSLTQIAPAESGIVVVVVDVTGAVISEAHVLIRNKDGKVAAGETDERGKFSAPDLAPGTYEVTVSAPGFKTFMAKSVTASRSVLTLDVALNIGATMGVIVGDSELVAIPTVSSSPNLQFLPEPDTSHQNSAAEPSHAPRPSRLKTFFHKLGF
jgi:hypothetical protein